MKNKQEKIAKRIQKIRKARQRSIHDCAVLLGISKEQYFQFENGTEYLSLPDIELLAYFLDVPLATFLDDSPIEDQSLFLLPSALRPRYAKLLHKMIRATFSLLRKQKELSLDAIQKDTEIPLDLLSAYERGNAPIPIDHLIKIAQCLDEPLESFIIQEHLRNPQHEDQLKQKWHPEYPEDAKVTDQEEEDPCEQLVDALKKVSKEEQARIAKILLNNLKS